MKEPLVLTGHLSIEGYGLDAINIGEAAFDDFYGGSTDVADAIIERFAGKDDRSRPLLFPGRYRVTIEELPDA